ncbi:MULTISPECIES: glycosyltransferase family 2 protein [Vreelandella]|uniref:Glycosyltransferase n=2 Tax=Vreelandella TaxID=3137766 RepID=A0A7C9P438_9GAMM|nr:MULTISPECIES: glycosyltransferase family 2 protein [Halomonas]NDL72050.1 glycosyltransferase [Halomonas alkaliphila]NYS44572.1 glycosyltransferase family 2 protein [Halomonas zhaodongensis]
MKVSLIITTYNWPEALALVLKSAINQDYKDYEIIIADDGSGKETQLCIDNFIQHSNVTIKHAWHEDAGFRAALIRNKAAYLSEGDYIIFIDGDCIIPPAFISDHVALSQKGFFIAGSRVKLSEHYTEELVARKIAPSFNRKEIFQLWLKKKLKRAHPALKLPTGSSLRFKRARKWQGAVTCNLSLWKQDLLAINGFDNDFIGWGLEDSDLVIRLINNSIYRKEGKFFSYVVHMHHKEASRLNESQNTARFQLSLEDRKTLCTSGINTFFEKKNESI